MKGPCWIKQWIADLAALNDQFRDEEGKIDFMALGREEYAFRTALITRKFAKSERARDTYMKAKAAYDVKVENGSKGGRPPKNKDELTAGAPNGNNGDESDTACENMRRVPQNEDPSHGFSGGNRPAQGSMSLPPSGAAHDGNNLGSGKPVSIPTISTDGPRQAENAQAEAGAPSHGGSVANNFAQTLDCLSDKASNQAASNTGITPPVVSRESGNIEDSLNSIRTGADNQRVGNTANVPPSDGLGEGTILFEEHDQETDPRGGCSEGIGAGDVSPLMIGEMTAQQSPAPYSSPVVDSSAKTRKKGTVANPGNRSHVETSTTVPAVVAPEDVRKPYGANRLVMLSKAEGDKLRELYGENLEMAIDILDSYIANSRKGQKYKSHASVLRRGNWVWNKVAETLLSEKRLENETKPRQRYMTSAEISERNAAIGWQRLQEDLARKRTGTDK